MEEEIKITEEEEVTEEKTEEPSLPDIVADIKAEYEAKLSDQAAKHAAEIKDRDDIIKQLIGGTGSETHKESFVDKINSKRNYKKW